MTRDEVLRAMTEIHSRWTDKVAEKVPVRAVDIQSGKSDYNEHHADVSAPAAVQDPLNRELVSLISRSR